MDPDRLAALFELIARRTPREFACHCGKELPISELGVFGHALLNCATLRQIFALWRDRSAISHHPLAGELSVSATSWTYEMRARIPLGADGLRFVAEASVAGFQRMCADIFGDTAILETVSFPACLPGSLPEFLTSERTSVTFGAPHLRLKGALGTLDARVSNARPALLNLCERRCDEELAAMDRSTPLATRVQMLLMVREPMPNAGEVAEEFGMSRRTLFRELALEGTTFVTVLDEVRRRLAFRILAECRLSAKEIGWRLGFENQCSFRRKFSEWTGLPISRWQAMGHPGQ